MKRKGSASSDAEYLGDAIHNLADSIRQPEVPKGVSIASGVGDLASGDLSQGVGKTTEGNIRESEKEGDALVSMENWTNGFAIVQQAYEQYKSAQERTHNEEDSIVCLAKM